MHSTIMDILSWVLSYIFALVASTRGMHIKPVGKFITIQEALVEDLNTG